MATKIDEKGAAKPSQDAGLPAEQPPDAFQLERAEMKTQDVAWERIAARTRTEFFREGAPR